VKRGHCCISCYRASSFNLTGNDSTRYAPRNLYFSPPAVHTSRTCPKFASECTDLSWGWATKINVKKRPPNTTSGLYPPSGKMAASGFLEASQANRQSVPPSEQSCNQANRHITFGTPRIQYAQDLCIALLRFKHSNNYGKNDSKTGKRIPENTPLTLML
jgi:hypothetical protein